MLPLGWISDEPAEQAEPVETHSPAWSRATTTALPATPSKEAHHLPMSDVRRAHDTALAARAV